MYRLQDKYDLSFRQTLSFRILVVSLLFFTLPLSGYFLWEIAQDTRSFIFNAEEKLSDLAKAKAELVTNAIKQADNALDRIVQDIQDDPRHFLQSGDTAVAARFKRVRDDSLAESLTLIQVSNQTLDVIHSSEPKLDMTLLNHQHQIKRQLGQSHFAYFSYKTINGQAKPVLYLGKMVHPKINQFERDYVLLMILDVETVLAQAFQFSRSMPGIDLSLIAENNLVFMSSDPWLRYTYLPTPQSREENKLLSELLFSELDSKPEHYQFKLLSTSPLLFELKQDNHIHLAAAHPIKYSNAALVLSTNKADLLTAIKPHIHKIIAALLMVIIISGVLTTLVIKSIHKPLRLLARTMYQVANGKNYARYQHQRFGYEINTLGSIFNDTVDNLLYAQKSAQEEQRQREKISFDLQVAQDIQSRLLPQKDPQFPRVSLASVFIPAKFVAGDFYDFYINRLEPRETLLLTIADATGKGIPAGLFSLTLRSMLRAQYDKTKDPAEIIHAANSLFREDTKGTGKFVTTFLLSFDPDTMMLSYVGCGHPPALIKRGQQLIPLDSVVTAMGIMQYRDFEAGHVQLESGDLLVLYTDGITEAENAAQELFGEERLQETLLGLGDLPLEAEAIAETILDAVRDFENPDQIQDDKTLIVACFK